MGSPTERKVSMSDTIEGTIEAVLPGFVVGARVRVVGTFALQHFKAASLFRDHVARLETENRGQEFGSFFEEIRSYSSACILSSVASLEALINEVFIAHGSPLRKACSDFETEFWGPSKAKERPIERWPVLKKYNKALAMLGAAELTAADDIYASVDVLVQLRNAFVHFKPEWDEKPSPLVLPLTGQAFALSPFPDEGADFLTMKCMSWGCCAWATTSVRNFIANFLERTGLYEPTLRSRLLSIV